jgi:hypothetical protein
MFKHSVLFLSFCVILACAPADKLKAERGSYFVIKQKSIETEKTLTYLIRLINPPSQTEPGNFEWYKMAGSMLVEGPNNFNEGTYTYSSGLRFEEVNLAMEKTLTNQAVFVGGKESQVNDWSAEICLKTTRKIEGLLNIDFSNCPSMVGIAQLGSSEMASSRTPQIPTDDKKEKASINFSIVPERWFFIISNDKNFKSRIKVVGFKLGQAKQNEIEYRWVMINNVSSLKSPIDLYELEYKVGNAFAVEFVNNVFFIGTSTSESSYDKKLTKVDDGSYQLEMLKGNTLNGTMFCTTDKSGSNDFFGFSLEYCTSLVTF